MKSALSLSLLGLAAASVVEQSVLNGFEASVGPDPAKNPLDHALEHANFASGEDSRVLQNVEPWLKASPSMRSAFDDESEEHPHPPRRPPHHRPHHNSNLTLYQLISESNYTTKLAKYINDYDDVVQMLNSTDANYTVFAPIDSAFEKLPKHDEHPSREDIKELLLYHISPKVYPAGRVLHSYTIPTLFKPEGLGHPQPLTVRLGFNGLSLNFYNRIVATDIFGTNGVIHGVDSITARPPRVIDIIELFPAEFSTLTLGLAKTGLLEKLNSTEYPHEGGTFFAPNNFAFQKLGPKINAFLFSEHGQKYLKALLKYHVVVNQTLYSDAFFDASSHQQSQMAKAGGFRHFDLPTVLKDKYLAVDIMRFGPFITIRINGFTKVTVHDAVASDGVIQVVSNVLVPPKKAPGHGDLVWEGEKMSVDDFKERLTPYVEDDNLEL